MIDQIIITTFICFGIYKATRSTDFLWFIKHYGDELLWYKLTKPIYNCPPCMGSVWSVVTSLYFGFGVELLLIIPAVSGLNYILTRLFPYSDD